jgi:hypothetical protein
MKKKILNFIVFGIFALALFIPIGLISLTIGPSRWLANYSKKVEWNASTESNFQMAIILTLVLFCSFLAFKILKKQITNNLVSKRLYIMLALSVLTISSLIFTFKPEILNVNKLNLKASKNENTIFEFGPYPDEYKLKVLKDAGFDGVVSLLHPLVVPAEPVLLNKEKNNAEKLHLKIISIPMLPWISENEEAIEKIKKLAHSAKGKYYVHCSLGRDRAGLFKKIIETENQQILVKSTIQYNQINPKIPFERGPVYNISKDVYLTSCPTDEELFHYFLNSKIKTVVNFMNANNKEDAVLIEKEKKIIEQHLISFYNFSVLETNSDKEIKETIEKIEKLPKPIIIHGFSTNHKNSKNFLKVYQSLK